MRIRYKTLRELLDWHPVDVDLEMLSAPRGAVRHCGYILMPDEVRRLIFNERMKK